MPNIKSAIKRVKTNEKARLRNASQKSNLRNAIKSVEVAVANNDQTNANSVLLTATKKYSCS
jgi:small subunit ribosomal protein S20